MEKGGNEWLLHGLPKNIAGPLEWYKKGPLANPVSGHLAGREFPVRTAYHDEAELRHEPRVRGRKRRWKPADFWTYLTRPGGSDA